jgi:DNA-binding Lrp family transcriptional regulator
MKLTQRDFRLFNLISTMAILTTAQLQRTFFNGIAMTTVLRRLRKLEKANYVQRIVGLPAYEIAWALTQKGAKTIGYESPKRNFHHLSLTHDVKLTELRLTLESHGVVQSWIPEHEIRSAMARKHGLRHLKGQVVPDGIMSVSYKDVMESVAVELELHYKNQDRYKQIFQSYIWKENIKAVWYFVQSAKLGKHLEKIWLKAGGGATPWLLWSEVGDVITNGAKAKIHYFADHSEIRNLFDVTKSDSSLAHSLGPGVSNQVEVSLVGKINLTSENQENYIGVAS